MRYRAWSLVAACILVHAALLAPPAGASDEQDDQVTLYTPAFQGPPALAESVAAIFNLQIWQTLRKAPSPNPERRSFGQGVVVWGPPLARFSHEEAEVQAKDASLLAQLVLWGKVYEYGDGAIAQVNLSIPEYHDFRTAHPERWTLEIPRKKGVVRFAADLPQRRYSFEPVVLTGEVIRNYSHPGALLLYASPGSKDVIGAVGDEFTALEHGNGWVKVRSKGKTGWLRLTELSANRNEVTDFVGGLIRIFRADWQGAEDLMSRVISNERAPNELRTDACLYKGMAAARQGHPSEAAFRQAMELSPTARRGVLYSVMGKLADYRVAQRGGASPGKLAGLLREARGLLEENSYLFEPEDPWLSEISRGLAQLGEDAGGR